MHHHPTAIRHHTPKLALGEEAFLDVYTFLRGARDAERAGVPVPEEEVRASGSGFGEWDAEHVGERGGCGYDVCPLGVGSFASEVVRRHLSAGGGVGKGRGWVRGMVVACWR